MHHYYFKDLFIDGDPTPLQQAARAIGQLQTIYGVIPKVYAKGKNAEVRYSACSMMFNIRLSYFFKWHHATWYKNWLCFYRLLQI